MRAYAQSRDQTLPTILLHGVELAIGPAGLDHNGPWGIHVGDDPITRAADQGRSRGGRAPARRQQGQPAAPRRREPDVRSRADRQLGARARRACSRTSRRRSATSRRRRPRGSPSSTSRPQISAVQGHHQQELRKTPMPRARSGRTRPPPVGGPGRTALGYASGSGAQSAVVRLGLAPHVSARLGRFVDRVVPSDFMIEAAERRVLNALGEAAAWRPARSARCSTSPTRSRSWKSSRKSSNSSASAT